MPPVSPDDAENSARILVRQRITKLYGPSVGKMFSKRHGVNVDQVIAVVQAQQAAGRKAAREKKALVQANRDLKAARKLLRQQISQLSNLIDKQELIVARAEIPSSPATELAKAKQQLAGYKEQEDEAQQQLGLLNTTNGAQEWIAGRITALAQEEKPSGAAPDVAVPGIFPEMAQADVTHAREQLVTAGNAVGGCRTPDQAVLPGAIEAVTENTRTFQGGGGGGHILRILHEVPAVVTAAHGAGYNVGEQSVQDALRNFAIAYASAIHDSDSGARDQDGSLIPGMAYMEESTNRQSMKKKF